MRNFNGPKKWNFFHKKKKLRSALNKRSMMYKKKKKKNVYLLKQPSDQCLPIKQTRNLSHKIKEFKS